MTSSSAGLEGRSYGWINRELFESGETLEHINVYGGEERFWIGPEGGQVSIFFKKGSEFTLDDWYAPKLIDLEAINVERTTANSVILTKNASLVNYSGFQFDLGIEREVKGLSLKETFEELEINQIPEIDVVAYKTTNSLINIGKAN